MGVRIFRNLAGLLFWTFFLLPVALIVNAIVLLSNYLGCRSGFELLNYERIELFRDELVGRILGDFFPEATQTHLFALAVSMGLAFGLFLFFHLGMKLVEHIFERKTYAARGDNESAALALQEIFRNIIYLGILAVPLVGAVYYDVILFRYRSTAGGLGIEDPVLATQQISGWAWQLKEKGQLMAWEITRFGVWGYLGITALCCFGMEKVLSRILDYGLNLVNNFQELVKAGKREEEESFHYGYDQEGNPVFDPQTPLVYDPEGHPLEQSGNLAKQGEDGHSEGTDRQTGQAYRPFEEPKTVRSDGQEVQEKLAFGTNSENETSEGYGKTDDPPREVIGKPGEWKTIAEALADEKQYWVDPDTHEIWDKAYREILFGRPFEKAA